MGRTICTGKLKSEGMKIGYEEVAYRMGSIDKAQLKKKWQNP
jgi:hypothetical protein